MKHTKGILTFSLVCLLSYFQSAAQSVPKEDKSDKSTVEAESTVATCDSILPLEERLRFSVVRFSINTTGVPAMLGDNMSTMLTNALQNTNCFRMLESYDNLEDMTKEIDMAKSEYAKKGKSPQSGKMLGAQFVVTGEITEYSKQDKDTKVLAVKVGKDIVTLGFIIKIMNPETRDVLFSQSFNVEGKASGGAGVGVNVPLLGKVSLAEASNNDPALAEAMENGILQAAGYIAKIKEDIPLPDESKQTLSFASIVVSPVSFAQVSEIEGFIKGVNLCKSIDKGAFSNSTITYNIEHEGTIYAVLDALTQASASKLEVQEVGEDGIIKLNMKQ